MPPMITTLTNTSYDAIHEHIAGKKLVILYPETKNRNVFISCLSEYYGMSMQYYCIRAEQKTLKSWLLGLTGNADFPVLAQALKDGDAASWAEALSADFANIAKQNGETALLLDEYDRVSGQRDEARFWGALLANLPRGVQIILNARQLGRDPWQEWIEKGDVRVLGREWRATSGMFSADPYERPTLEVFTFGEGRVLINGHEVSRWDGVLPRNLFFYLIDRPLVTRDEIFHAFWPTLSVREATNVFHVTKRKITDRLSRVSGNKNIELTQYRSGYYIPSDQLTRCIDVDEFREMAECAESGGDAASMKLYYLRAVELYRGEFLETVDMDWVAQRREQYREMVTEALQALSQIALAESQPVLARDYLLRALAHSPERDDLHHYLQQITG